MHEFQKGDRVQFSSIYLNNLYDFYVTICGQPFPTELYLARGLVERKIEKDMYLIFWNHTSVPMECHRDNFRLVKVKQK